MKKLIFILLLVVSAASGQSIRPSHWLGEYTAFMQARGFLWSLSPLTQPYESAEVYAQVAEETGDSSRAARAVVDHSRYLLERLSREPQRDGEGRIGAEVAQSYRWSDSDRYFHSVNRLAGAYRLRPWLYVAGEVLMDNRLDDDPDYMGIRQSGVSAYQETAYLRLRHQGWSLTAGRDYLRLGPGLDAALFLSDHSRPLDQVRLAYQAKRWRYAFIASQLDFYAVTDSRGRVQMNRYLTVHRLEIRPHRRLHLAVGEAVLYGSTAGAHWAYFNPFIFFHGEQMNGPLAANILGCLQAAWMPRRNLTFYADLLIDDVQIEKNEPGDFEPDEYGLTIGGRWADPGGVRGLDLFAEYTRVTQRTYNSLFGDWEKFLHRRQPLGHYLGNDFERWIGAVQYWPVVCRRIRLSYEYRRKGEDRVEKPFTDPWMRVEDYRNYSEPFPTGVVENSRRLRCELEWRPRWWLSGKADVAYITADHYAHQRGRREHFWQAQVGVALEGIVKMAVGR